MVRLVEHSLTSFRWPGARMMSGWEAAAGSQSNGTSQKEKRRPTAVMICCMGRIALSHAYSLETRLPDSKPVRRCIKLHGGYTVRSCCGRPFFVPGSVMATRFIRRCTLQH